MKHSQNAPHDDPRDERRHLTPLGAKKLLAATKGARQDARDRCLILLARFEKLWW